MTGRNGVRGSDFEARRENPIRLFFCESRILILENGVFREYREQCLLNYAPFSLMPATR